MTAALKIPAFPGNRAFPCHGDAGFSPLQEAFGK